jgi:hypothetical protein
MNPQNKLITRERWYKMETLVKLKGNIGKKYNLVGKIIARQSALIFEGATFSGEKYKVKWDNPEHGTSGWIKASDLETINLHK